ncbi:MAG TPA: PAS domain S-box protein, partial [Archaeoglobaceae archaeon]|nr:PAS domain S-box protein [Archaeoglobaceae archaeon]
MIKKLSKLSTHLRVIREINRLLRESDLERLLDSICQILKRERKYIDVFTGILETGEQVSFIDNFKQKNIFSIHCIKKAIESERQLIVEDKRLNCKGCDFRTLNHFAAIFTFETSAGRMFLCVISKHRLDEEEIELLNEVTELMKISVDKIKTEEALRKSEEKYRLLAENVRDVIWTSDLNLNFTYLTPSIERVFGYTAEEFKKLNPEDYLTPESLEIVKNVLSEALSSDKIRKKPSASKILELEAYRKDGSKFYIELNASLLRDSNGKPYGIIGITRDITERKNIEKALKESEKTLRGILKASPVGIGIAEKRVFRFVNKKFCEMVGYSPEELIGKNSRILYETDEEYERVGKIKYLQIKEKGFGIIETRFRRKDGKIIDVLLSSSAIDPSDLSRGIIFTAMDISERKRARKKLEESEKKYRAIFENTGTAMAIIEEDTTISTVNSEFEKLSGYKKEEIEGKM